MQKFDIDRREQTGSNIRLFRQEFPSTHFLPKNVGDFGTQQVRCGKSITAQRQSFGRPRFGDDPFDDNAGVNDDPPHRSSRLSR
jgi:hypothetical protein